MRRRIGALIPSPGMSDDLTDTPAMLASQDHVLVENDTDAR
jgi:hypothetical protein